MKKTFASLFFVASAVVTVSAQADTFNFSYLSDDALTTAAGQLFTTGSDVTSMTGTINGMSITSLIGSAGVQTSPSGAFYFDNIVYPGPALSSNGLLFSVTGDAGGQEWNLWGNGGTSGSLYSFVSGGYNVQTNGTLNISAVPEPESYAMLLAGLGLMGFMVRRRKTS